MLKQQRIQGQRQNLAQVPIQAAVRRKLLLLRAMPTKRLQRLKTMLVRRNLNPPMNLAAVRVTVRMRKA